MPYANSQRVSPSYLFIVLINEYFTSVRLQIVGHGIAEHILVTDLKRLRKYVLHVRLLIAEHRFQTVANGRIKVLQIGKRSPTAHQFPIDDHWKVHSQNDIIVNS